MGQGQFVHSVASGDPTSESIVLWTRVTLDDAAAPADIPLRWEIRSESPDSRVASGDAVASPEHDYTVHVAADGLDSDTTFRYRFEIDGATSPLGRFRTLPVEASTAQLGVVACAKFNAGYFNAYRALAARNDVNLVICLGDYIYEAANKPPASQTPGADIGRDFSPLHECYTLDDYRERYSQYRRDPDAQAMHEAHAVVATIDDHELADNAWSGGARAVERPRVRGVTGVGGVDAHDAPSRDGHGPDLPARRRGIALHAHALGDPHEPLLTRRERSRPPHRVRSRSTRLDARRRVDDREPVALRRSAIHAGAAVGPGPRRGRVLRAPEAEACRAEGRDAVPRPVGLVPRRASRAREPAAVDERDAGRHERR